MIGTLEKDLYTDWISTYASAWRREVLENYKFDEWFESYSYLEDLDFSFIVGKEWKLAIVADAKFYHHHSPKGRESGFEFGKREIKNRIYFVRKYKELSVFLCTLTLICRVLLSIMKFLKFRSPIYHIQQVLGNLKGFLESF
jgi:GT2 family glycosyltransferase